MTQSLPLPFFAGGSRHDVYRFPRHRGFRCRWNCVERFKRRTERAFPAEPRELPIYCRCNGLFGIREGHELAPRGKVRALKKADAIGATHVVWKSFKELGVLNGVADGAAYRCDERSIGDSRS